jgi:methionine synthase II (cobalamin-independent)
MAVNGVHLVGSIPLGSSEEVFRTVAGHLGDRVDRIPDGETGPRALWISYQLGRLSQLPWFEMRPPMSEGVPPTLGLKHGVDASEVEFGDLGYADVARASFEIFDDLQAQGVIPAGVKFQVSLPTPLANAWAWMSTDPQFHELASSYEQAMHVEVDRILDALPHDRLCMQWDVCVEVWGWEGWIPMPYPDAREEIVASLARCIAWIPDDVELGLHLCYGDWQHEHLSQPTDTANVVGLCNQVLAAVARPISFLHIPVPIDRDDDAYFAPLKDLGVPDGTRIYLGLVHFRDGADGARRRIAAAQRVLDDFGVATECGMGRRPPDRGGASETLGGLLEIHAAVSDPVR